MVPQGLETRKMETRNDTERLENIYLEHSNRSEQSLGFDGVHEQLACCDVGRYFLGDLR